MDESDIGCPQGGVISALLMNIYLDYFDKAMMEKGIRIVRYADDTLIFARAKALAGKYMAMAIHILEKDLKLKVNKVKTHIANASKELFHNLFGWIKRRLRMKQMKEWKSYKSLHKAVRRRGYKGKFEKISMSRWRNSNCTLVHMALPNIWFKEIGLVHLSEIQVGILSNYYE